MDKAVFLGLIPRFEGADICVPFLGPSPSLKPQTENRQRERPHLGWDALNALRVIRTLGGETVGPCSRFCGLVTSSANLKWLKMIGLMFAVSQFQGGVRTWSFLATCTAQRSHMRGSQMVAVLGFIPQALQWVELCPSKVTFAWNLKCGLL